MRVGVREQLANDSPMDQPYQYLFGERRNLADRMERATKIFQKGLVIHVYRRTSGWIPLEMISPLGWIITSAEGTLWRSFME